MKKGKTHIYVTTVEISNIDVSKEYYSFDYKIHGAVAGSGSYESDYENGNTPDEQYEWLLDGGAVNLALLQEVE